MNEKKPLKAKSMIKKYVKKGWSRKKILAFFRSIKDEKIKHKLNEEKFKNMLLKRKLKRLKH